jgi:hypothetical protein
MYRIILNDAAGPAANRCETWGELLDVLDRRCAERGHVVTAARFDGVGLPALRHPDTLRQPLGAVQVVEVESTPPRDLLLSTLAEADRAVVALAAAAARIGGDFRGFDVLSANDELAEFAQSLGTIVTLAGVLSQAIGRDLSTIRCDGASAVEMIREMTTHAEALIGAEQIGDWITVADVVEYDIAPSLARWPSLFACLRESVDQASIPVV